MENKTFPATLDSLDDLRDLVREKALLAHLDKKKTYNLMLALDEIATNIILYGYEQAGKEGVLDVITDLSDRQLTIVVEDDAAPFDPLQRDLPDEDDFSKPLEERPIGGMGIFLTINGVDEFRYEYTHNRNRNIFIMNVPATEA
ncbi:ATP-binding protein [Arsenicibacter rosenii]|uniref:Anti-sigma regulatory factor n=1 Tax=Arsenicibacter rosenii TaxID=1750698 RepID=A0A1S2VPH5_9BACT|nr:ATP-binding protein [Arsenicibacter rosenii]OIN60652.1 anti-sigma regulatory factor [Arsenicibacter rosenii]